MSAINNHFKEFEIANCEGHPDRVMPEVLSTHKRILDVGCGIGQTLLALNLPSNVEAYGVDIDAEAIRVGSSLLPANIHIILSSGESLPFPSGCFDLVFSRVALPYMHIPTTLAEIARVTRIGGQVWLALHPASMVFARALESLLRGNLRDVAGCALTLLNGILFNSVGLQLRRHRETFQTLGGMKRAMKRSGLTCELAPKATHFVVQGSNGKKAGSK